MLKRPSNKIKLNVTVLPLEFLTITNTWVTPEGLLRASIFMAIRGVSMIMIIGNISSPSSISIRRFIINYKFVHQHKRNLSISPMFQHLWYLLAPRSRVLLARSLYSCTPFGLFFQASFSTFSFCW